jgi:predicted nucleic acid-binding protein
MTLHGIDTTFLVQVEVREVPGHEAARDWLDQALAKHPQPLALAPQVLTEFVHVVTDPRRFAAPLSMEEALAKAQGWWEACEVKLIYPSLDSTRLALLWLRQHRLGRKRLLDTQLAATYYAAGITRLLTLNMSDFEVFGVFHPQRLNFN